MHTGKDGIVSLTHFFQQNGVLMRPVGPLFQLERAVTQLSAPI